MHLFIAVEGHSGAIRRFEEDFDRRVYKGKGRGGGDAVVKLGELKFYDVRFNEEARDYVLSDLKSIGFVPVEKLTDTALEGSSKMKMNWIMRAFKWAARAIGIKAIRDWGEIENKHWEHGLDKPDGPYRIGAGGYCMWKVVLGEKKDWRVGEQEQV
jgi:hypothetical protein